MKGEDNIATLVELKLGLVLIIDRLEGIYLQAKHDITDGVDAAPLLSGTSGITHEIWDAIIEAYDNGEHEFVDGWLDQPLAKRTKAFIDSVRDNFGPFGYTAVNIAEPDGVTIKPKAFNDLRLSITEDRKPIDMHAQLDIFVQQVIRSVTHFSNINPT